MMLLRAHSFTDVSQWETRFYRKGTSLTNFRHKILYQKIQLGLAVNLQSKNTYNWNPGRISLITNILAEFIRHGLMYFLWRSQPSLPLRLICLSISACRTESFCRRWRKHRHLREQIHQLVGQWYDCRLMGKDSISILCT